MCLASVSPIRGRVFWVSTASRNSPSLVPTPSGGFFLCVISRIGRPGIRAVQIYSPITTLERGAIRRPLRPTREEDSQISGGDLLLGQCGADLLVDADRQRPR